MQAAVMDSIFLKKDWLRFIRLSFNDSKLARKVHFDKAFH